MSTQTFLRPDETGEVLLGGPTQQLNPPSLRRPDAEQWRTVDQLPQSIAVVDEPRPAEVLVPLVRPAAPGELYADSRARRGLPPLNRPRGYVGRHRAGRGR